jgi:DNA polymerase
METARALESLLAFWADAGVDAALSETSVDRLAAREPPPRRPEPVDIAAQAEVVPSSLRHDAVEAARTAAAGAGDLEALARAIADFDGCPLKAGARQSVFSRGRSDAPVLAIGEGPGADEDARGVPFVGRAGQLLDRMLAAADLTDQVFITNTVFWRPPGNRTPTSDEQSICEPFLERAIELVRPRLLLLLGAAPAKFLLRRTEGVLQLRGRWFEWRSRDGALEIPALPTLHPAFLLRQPLAKKKSWEDLLLLRERLNRPRRPA